MNDLVIVSTSASSPNIEGTMMDINGHPCMVYLPTFTI